MPRLPVDGKRVIEHRITFGTKERELLDNVATSYSINKVATPLVALISDISALAFLTSIYISFKYGKPALNKMKDSYESVEELMKDVGNIIEDATTELTPEVKASVQKARAADTRKYHCNTPGGIPYMCGPDDPNYTGPEKRKAPSWDSFYGGYAQPKVDPRTAKKQQKFMDSRSGKSTKKFYDSRSARKAAKR